MKRPTDCSFAVLLALVLSTACGATSAGAAEADPNVTAQFVQVKDWTGAFTTGAQSSGKYPLSARGTCTFSSSIHIEGRFKLARDLDRRNGSEVIWRGKGEAHITLSGKRTQSYPDNTVVELYAGDYIDTCEVQLRNYDPKKGTYQLTFVRDEWQDQPHKGKAVEKTTITKEGRRVQMIDGHSWAGDGGAGLSSEAPLPKQGLIIDGRLVRNNDDYLSVNGSRWVSTWQIRPAAPGLQEPLKAVAGGPYSVERGRAVNLDGWKSTGKIRSYKWTFEPADPKSTTVPFNAGAAKEGKRVPVTVLAAFKATLTVSDGTKEDSDSVIVTVSARDYQTPFLHLEGEKLHPNSIAPRMIKGRDLRYAGGENVCALDSYGGNDAIHCLHPGDKAGSWKGNGYQTKKVEDPGGPFDGVWYVADYQIRVERQTLVNKYLLPKGPPPVRTAKPFYEANKALGNDVDAYLAAVRKHELLHSELMQKALKSNDPGPHIEAFASKDENAIKTQADKEIQTAEDAITKASADPLPSVGFKGKIAFPDDATDAYKSVEMEI